MEFTDTFDDIALTSELYSVSLDTDSDIIREFPILLAATDPGQKPSLKPQQTEAQIEATRMLLREIQIPSPRPSSKCL